MKLVSTWIHVVAFQLERYYRHRREIGRLYQPLGAGPDDVSSDDEDDYALPTHAPVPQQKAQTSTPRQDLRLKNVWDTREDLFDIGEADEEEEDAPAAQPNPWTAP
jgi:hypothetical protein